MVWDNLEGHGFSSPRPPVGSWPQQTLRSRTGYIPHAPASAAAPMTTNANTSGASSTAQLDPAGAPDSGVLPQPHAIVAMPAIVPATQSALTAADMRDIQDILAARASGSTSASALGTTMVGHSSTSLPGLGGYLPGQSAQQMPTSADSSSASSDPKHMTCQTPRTFIKVLQILEENGNSALPLELLDKIAYMAHSGTSAGVDPAPLVEPPLPIWLHPARHPPADGSCKLMELPMELRELIFKPLILSENVVIHPTCSKKATETSPSKKATEAVPRIRRPKRNDTGNLMAVNRKLLAESGTYTSDLMTVNRKLLGEIKTWLYKEHTFVVHVHEGLFSGGIEFLDAGRQSLQFQDCESDTRFARFNNLDEYGFKKVKKLTVVFYPAANKARHTALSTHYMSTALARLLDRGSKEEERIKRLNICFAMNNSSAEESVSYWWDGVRNQPRSTSMNCVSDIELVLHPFSILTRIHNVTITLPPLLRGHEPTTSYAKDLAEGMKSTQLLPQLHDDLLSQQAEWLREQMEEYIFTTKYGAKPAAIDKLTQDEMMEENEEFKDTQKDEEVNPNGARAVDIFDDGDYGDGESHQSSSLLPHQAVHQARKDQESPESHKERSAELYRARQASIMGSSDREMLNFTDHGSRKSHEERDTDLHQPPQASSMASADRETDNVTGPSATVMDPVAVAEVMGLLTREEIEMQAVLLAQIPQPGERFPYL
ncbi:Hypothetical predicted protein [Lecanosticta acicola]|uniref:Uncharacterized protein n=1 Tax=Lecanosticta acicola TaxID=111012 RepID=A0AAI9E7T0_9PEZI|nr:Hypothetical predicted protein [Lecanosticta acicola]